MIDIAILTKGFFLVLLNNLDLVPSLLPALIVIELPLTLTVISGVVAWKLKKHKKTKKTTYPKISFVITCYGEGDAISITIDSLVEQIYPGNIEILAVVDGATQNAHTYNAALNGVNKHKENKKRFVKIVPKWQRGGRVSTLNAGLHEATGDIIINVDGDTSFDNNMALEINNELADPNIMACGGALRARNFTENTLTKLQAIEYMLSMQTGKTGLGHWGVLNNISGAFGAFRKETLKQVGGWDTHTAEDLDLTMRLKQYKGRHPNLTLAFSPRAVGHTDVPSSIHDLIWQRLRWDGDLFFLFLRKHKNGLSPKLLGWKNFIYTLVYGVLQNALLPFLVVYFTLYLVIKLPLTAVISAFTALYLIYLVASLLMFTFYILLISERKKEDLKLSKWLLAYPIYQYLMRLVTAVSAINELTRRSHEESSMAPWWTLKKGKKF